MGRKDEIRQQIAKLGRELERLEALPDGDAMANGTVVAVGISYPGGRLYHFVGLKAGGHWYFTGRNAPQQASWDNVMDWLTSGTRRVVAFAELARINVDTSAPSPVLDLGGLLADLQPGDVVAFGVNYDDVYGVG